MSSYSNKNNVFGVSDSVFSLADLYNRKLHLACASVSNGANVNVQISLALMVMMTARFYRRSRDTIRDAD